MNVYFQTKLFLRFVIKELFSHVQDNVNAVYVSIVISCYSVFTTMRMILNGIDQPNEIHHEISTYITYDSVTTNVMLFHILYERSLIRIGNHNQSIIYIMSSVKFIFQYIRMEWIVCMAKTLPSLSFPYCLCTI